MSEYKLLCKNPEGSQYKWSNMGNMKTNEWGNFSIGLQISRLKEAIVTAEREGKSFINLSVFDDKLPVNDGGDAKHTEDRGSAAVSESAEFTTEELDDEIPF